MSYWSISGFSQEIFQKTGDDEIFDNREKIIGGSYVNSISEVPYQVSIQKLGIHLCGGTIVTPMYIITAAHCFKNYNIKQLTVKTGTHNLTNGGQVHKVEKVIPHPQFSDKIAALGVQNDVAVIKVSILTVNSFVHLTCIFFNICLQK